MHIADPPGPSSFRRSSRRTKPFCSGLVPAAGLSLLFGLLFLTGLILEFVAGRNWNSGLVVLLIHVGGGLLFTGLFLFWIPGHCRHGLARSQRAVFTWLSWLLLAKYLVLIVSGLMLVTPGAAYIAGVIWFWSFETTFLLTDLHLWASFAAVLGLLLHLGLRHWRPPAFGRGGLGQ